MNRPYLALEDIIQKTLEYGEGWAVGYARRLQALIREIGLGMDYDQAALTLATYLHDWGAFPCFAQPGIEHALRSRQVAEADILPRMDLSPAVQAVISRPSSCTTTATCARRARSRPCCCARRTCSNFWGWSAWRASLPAAPRMWQPASAAS